MKNETEMRTLILLANMAKAAAVAIWAKASSRSGSATCHVASFQPMLR